MERGGQGVDGGGCVADQLARPRGEHDGRVKDEAGSIDERAASAERLRAVQELREGGGSGGGGRGGQGRQGKGRDSGGVRL